MRPATLAGRPILFIHGISQCALAWSRQLDSELARDHRLVAMDLRGHGLSDKPRDAYGDSRLWADDVRAVIDTLNLDRPVLCGWSYGPLVFLDYLRHYGEDRIGGIHFVGGITKLGSDAAMSVISPEFLSLVPGFFATDVEESVRSLESLLRLCFARAAVGERSVPHAGVQRLSAASCPAGPALSDFRQRRSLAQDSQTCAHHARRERCRSEAQKSWISTRLASPHAQVHIMPNAGHTPFWQDSSAFNQRLRAFVEMCSAAAMARPAIA